MAHSHGLSIEEQRKADIGIGVKGFIILLLITFGEVAVAIFGKGLLPGLVLRLIMIALSLYKAYYIVSIFMHLGGEVRSMAMSIVLPMLLLVWAVIAFLWQGEAVRDSRNYVNGNDPLKEKAPKAADDRLGIQKADDLPKNISFE